MGHSGYSSALWAGAFQEKLWRQAAGSVHATLRQGSWISTVLHHPPFLIPAAFATSRVSVLEDPGLKKRMGAGRRATALHDDAFAGECSSIWTDYKEHLRIMLCT
eukprot:scaffold229701_cov18-Tisochrysis_lutea.AAC.1